MSFFILKTKRPCVFIHIPKTGGLSIRGQGGRWEGALESGARTEKRSDLETRYKDHFKFAFVRNPWERVISGYFYTKKMRERLNAVPFRQFLQIVTDSKIPFDFSGMSTPEGWIRHHTIPMTHPYNGLDFANYVGRFETIQHDFNTICRMVGEKPRQLPHNNPTGHLHYSTYYDSETFEIVADYFAEDIKTFGYTYESSPPK